MTDTAYFIISVVVFCMLVFGIFLTVLEFKKLEEDAKDD
tara:strand:+ start:394 stop:510 length:117 start_codon:yes stop_codon:yes gene_type:complete